MLPGGAADKLFQWDLEFSPARKPGAVDSIASAIDVAVPDTLEAKQNIALQPGSGLPQFISKPDDGRRSQPLYRSKWPLVLRPITRGHKLDIVASFDDSACKSSQVRLST